MKKLTMAVVAIALLSISAFASHTRQDIVDTAVQAGSFNTLAKALKAADLVDNRCYEDSGVPEAMGSPG